ncbi:MAG: hypothetical protein EOR51_29975 [Mesorhizobium sp.]|nr:MAG: hypothetical protein EOR51_29975 [Mesorhizobium sp.]
MAEHASLSEFPIVSKELFSRHFEEFLDLERFPDFVLTSGGTSESGPSITIRNVEEYLASFHYFSGVDPAEPPPLDQVDGFTLDIFFNSNGYGWRKPHGWPILSVTLEQDFHADMILRFVADGLQVAGRRLHPNRIQAQNGPLRTLTGYLEATGFNAADSAIVDILVYGGHVTAAWQARLERVWGAQLRTIYGLSEFGGCNAVECAGCGAYHYWSAWPEFLGLRDDDAVERGDARLILTSLVPFVRAQPRIRYDTGDVVTVVGRCEATGELGFRFRGRMASSLIGGSGARPATLVSEIDVLEAIDDLPEVGRRPHSSETQIWSNPSIPRPPYPLGFPRFKISAGPEGRAEGGLIAIETAFDPEAAPRKAQALEARVWETLLGRTKPELREAMLGKRRPSIRLLGPGRLGVRIKAAV